MLNLIWYFQLYLGSVIAAKDKELLKRLKIGHVLNAANGCPCSFPDEVIYHCCYLDDEVEVDLSPHFATCYDFIGMYLEFASRFMNTIFNSLRKENGLNNDGAVLVHCEAGISRSSSIVLSYLMRKKGMTLEEAFLHTRSKKPNVNPTIFLVLSLIIFQIGPNIGFFKQLMAYEQSLFGKTSFSVEDYYTATFVRFGDVESCV